MKHGDLSEAVIAYIGYHRAASPQADWAAVIDSLGPDRANAVEIPMLGVLSELYKQNPDWGTHSLFAASEWAVRQVRARHPEINDRAAKALVWKFSYDNR